MWSVTTLLLPHAQTSLPSNMRDALTIPALHQLWIIERPSWATQTWPSKSVFRFVRASQSPDSRTLRFPIDGIRTGNSYRYAGLEYYGEVNNRRASSPHTWIVTLTMWSFSASVVPRSMGCRLMSRTAIVGLLEDLHFFCLPALWFPLKWWFYFSQTILIEKLLTQT
jgi:hypothetical protein